MRGRTWLPAKPKPPSKPKVADDVREAVDALAAPVVAKLKKRYCKTPKNPQFNWPDDFFSQCAACCPRPKMMMKGKFRGHNVFVTIALEPQKGSAPAELLDTITKEVRPKEESP